MKIIHRFLACFVIILSGTLSSQAAAPREITIDSLYYFIEGNEARVSAADIKIREANILETVEISGVEYPVTRIPYQGFQNCSFLSKVVFPSSIKEIGGWAFEKCTALEEIELPADLQTIEDYTFSRCTSLRSIVVPKRVTSIGGRVFYNCSNLSSVTLPDGLLKIGSNAFRDCISLKELLIPNTVNSIGSGCFDYSAIEELSIPYGIESIESSLCSHCTGLKKVNLPLTVRSIDNYAFEYTAISTIYLPQYVHSIGVYAFRNCTELETIYSYNTTPPSMGTSAFYDSYPEFITLHVPEGCKEKYAAAEGWNKFLTIIDDLPSNSAGIENISSPENTTTYDVFTPAGVKVSSDTYNLAPGLYIVRNGATCSKIVIR